MWGWGCCEEAVGPGHRLPELEAWHALEHSSPPAPPLIIFFISKFQNFNYVSPNTISGLSFQQDAAQGE